MTLHGDTRWERWLRNVAGAAFWGMYAVAAVGAAQSCLTGCGSRADTIGMHADAAMVVREALHATASLVDKASEEQRLAAVNVATSRADAIAETERIRESWAVVDAAQHAAVDAWAEWAALVSVAARSTAQESSALLMRALAGVVRAYGRLVEFVRDANGPPLPRLPDVVTALVGGL